MALWCVSWNIVSPNLGLGGVCVRDDALSGISIVGCLVSFFSGDMHFEIVTGVVPCGSHKKSRHTKIQCCKFHVLGAKVQTVPFINKVSLNPGLGSLRDTPFIITHEPSLLFSAFGFFISNRSLFSKLCYFERLFFRIKSVSVHTFCNYPLTHLWIKKC